ncbi:MAG: DUF429 domain-containing protein [Bdellovibrio sp.]|nr:DUF429 domain-containing protein [Bdellovibrio sp.]
MSKRKPATGTITVKKISAIKLNAIKPTVAGNEKNNDIIRFLGVSLAGGKSDKACVALIEYYPKNQKIFLSRLYEKIKSEERISADLKIHELIEQNKDTLEYVAFDVPWRLPSCITCQLPCPGYEVCKEPHITWMWSHFETKNKKKKPKKIFTPYTQRATEMYMATELEETFMLHNALGSNTAPLLARANFITKRMPPQLKCIEVYPKLTLWRIGRTLDVMKSHLRHHRAAFGGDESRRLFLHAMSERNLTFIYHQDMKQMIENSHAFDAFMCALTGFLKYKGLTEKKPVDFPPYEDWIEFPKASIRTKDFV